MKRIAIILFIGIICIGWGNNGGWDGGTYYARQISYPAERATTSDTLTAGERGKTISVDCTSICEFELPIATVGSSFTFISEAAEVFYVDPASTDYIQWTVGGTALSIGEKMTSPGATNDTLTLISTRANYWSVVTDDSWTNGGD